MSAVASESVFLSALQPNTSVTTYALPSDTQLGNGGFVSDEVARARRVQQQVQLRMAEKSTLPRQNGSASQYAMSDYGSSSTVKYNTFTPNFTAKSAFMYNGSKTMGPRVSQRTGFSARSAGAELSQYPRMSMVGGMAGGGSGGGYYQEDIRMGNYQGSMRAQTQMEPETFSVQSMRQQTAQVNPWMLDGSDAASMVSDRDAGFSHQYAHSAVNGYTGQVRQGSTMTFQSPMRRSLSGTLSRGGGMSMGGAEIIQQQSFKGPAHRTISRITNRNRMSMGSMSGTMQQPAMSSSGSTYGGGGGQGGFIVSSGSQGNLLMQRPGTLSRAMSIKSMHSVGRGMDIFDGQMEMGASMGNLSGINSLDMPTAVQNLREPDPELQVLGAAYIQHQCYNDSDSKEEVRRLHGIGELVKLFNSDNQEVRRYVTGATRNLIYENMENKTALIDEGGISELVKALSEPDDELHKNITGILWNLSSKDNLKEKLAREALPELTDKILIPLSAKEIEDAEKTVDEESKNNSQSHSQAEIFCNTTGCLRNLSSVNEKTRHIMRERKGLVSSLVDYIRACLEKNKTEDKGVENAMCVLRNLSYQLYNELPPSVALRLEGNSRADATKMGETVGCFPSRSKNAKKSQTNFTFSEVSRQPKDMEWLWHPQIVSVYNRVLQTCETKHVTREAAAGALQNITAGDKRWASALSSVALEQERMLPVVLDLLSTKNDLELRSLTGFLRNLSRHTSNKDNMATKTVNQLVEKLPDDGHQKEPSSEVVVNICGILNNLVTSSSLAARDISFFNGLPKLMAIKNSHDHSPGKLKAAKAAATVLTNMFHYKKLHKQYREKGFSKEDFIDNTL
ncbi:plakophilin-3a isoform X1 [Acanthochromis polyacanthus]|uniref:plakophilin-3a isoform X1 n=1 Tax=Acanthochromis polyacanthus TaxID=80966 RepID=UPI002234829F|nr:plakophilin-3a isoform X1 [Acanthochromis polyacanthus]